MITPMIARAALHMHHIDMGAAEWGRSYTYEEAKQLRDDLLMFGYSEREVDANGTLDASDYEDEGEEGDAVVFVFDHEGESFEVRHDGCGEYDLYDDGGYLLIGFNYNGDPEDHHNIEDAAIDALQEYRA